MNPERPLPVTILCLLGIAVCSLGTILVYSPSILKLGVPYALYRSFSFAFLIACFAGLWLMRRWAVWALATYFVINQAVCLTYGIWEMGTLGPLLILSLTFIYYRRMH